MSAPQWDAPVQHADPATPDDRRSGGMGVNAPTVMMAAGLAGIVAAVILAIGMTAVLLVARDDKAAEQPTVVNLGAQQTQLAGAPQAPAAQAPAGEAPAGEAPAGAPAATEPAAPGAPAPAAPAAPAGTAPTAAAPAAGGPTAPTLAGFKSDFALLASGASTQQKAAVLEDGARAVPPITNLLRLAKQFEPAGMRYELVGPVTQNGDTAGARLKLTSPGYDPAYATMTYVWKDGRWKLTSKSICDLAAHASQPCNI